MKIILFKTEVYDIIGMCMAVHNYLGNGFLEIVYKDALQFELLQNGINFEREKQFAINYKGFVLPHKFYADFFIMDKIIVEIKSTKEGMAREYIAKVLNYLKVSKIRLGLIVNFGNSSLEYKRFIL